MKRAIPLFLAAMVAACSPAGDPQPSYDRQPQAGSPAAPAAKASSAQELRQARSAEQARYNEQRAREKSCERKNRTSFSDAIRCRRTTYLANGVEIWIDYETGCEFFWQEYYDGSQIRSGPGAPRPANGMGEQLCRQMP